MDFTLPNGSLQTTTTAEVQNQELIIVANKTNIKSGGVANSSSQTSHSSDENP